MSTKLKGLLVSGAVLLLGLTLGASPKASAMSTSHQSGDAMAGYNYYHFANNYNYKEPDSMSYHFSNNTDPTRVLHAVGGNLRMNYVGKENNVINNNGVFDDWDPQSVVITPNGKVFVEYGGVNNGADNDLIARYNINNLGQVEAYGNVFNGGHGQGLAYNPANNTLWTLGNHSGSAEGSDFVDEISMRTLNPIHKLVFHADSDHPFGDVLTFDKNGNAYMSTITFGGSAPHYSLKLYKGRITAHSIHFHMVQGVRHAPGLKFQNMNYDPNQNRIYIVVNSELMSIPVSKIGHLSGSDIKVTKLSGGYEFEDLAFYQGHGYLLVHYPNELLVSDHAYGHASAYVAPKKANKKPATHKARAKKSRKASKKHATRKPVKRNKKAKRGRNRRAKAKNVKRYIKDHYSYRKNGVWHKYATGHYNKDWKWVPNQKRSKKVRRHAVKRTRRNKRAKRTRRAKRTVKYFF